MPWLQGVLATIGFFLISIFGGSTTPIASVSTEQSHSVTHALTSIVTSNHSTTTDTATSLSEQVSATTTFTPSTWILLSSQNASNIKYDPYSIQNGQVTYDGQESGDGQAWSDNPWILKGVNPADFMVSAIDSDWGETNSQVFVRGDLLAGADPKTLALTTVAASYTPSEGTYDDIYAQDATHVWCDDNNAGQVYTETLLQDADPNTFTLFPGSSGSSAKDKTHVWLGCTEVLGADPNTFTFIPSDEGFEKDANHVYDNGTVINSADPATFQLINDSSGNWTGFEEDANHVYAVDTMLSGATPNNFKFITSSLNSNAGWVTNGSTVWNYFIENYNGFSGSYSANLWVAQGVDAATFSAVPGGDFVKDKNHVYFVDQNSDSLTTVSADPATFAEVSDTEGNLTDWYKDKDNVYTLSQNRSLITLSGADPYTFVVIADPDGDNFSQDVYEKDQNHVYFKTSIIIGSDPSTFMYMSSVSQGGAADFFQKDKNQVYYFSSFDDASAPMVITGADPTTFHMLLPPIGEAVAADKNHEYNNQGKVVQ